MPFDLVHRCDSLAQNYYLQNYYLPMGRVDQSWCLSLLKLLACSTVKSSCRHVHGRGRACEPHVSAILSSTRMPEVLLVCWWCRHCVVASSAQSSKTSCVPLPSRCILAQRDGPHTAILQALPTEAHGLNKALIPLMLASVPAQVLNGRELIQQLLQE